jgi:hypothetical protein
MSIDWSHLTGASLAIAIGLTALAGLAWLQLWARPGDDGREGAARGDARAEHDGEDGLTRAARDHLTALAQWALGALALHALCLIGNGSGSFGGWAITIVLALAATALQYPPGGRVDEEPDDEPVEAPAPAPLATEPLPPLKGPLWAGHGDDARAGLWGDAVKR